MPPVSTFTQKIERSERRNTGSGQKHHRTWEAEIRADKKPDGSYFEGYAAVLHSIDEYGTIVGQGSLDRDLEYFKRQGFIGGLNHNWAEPIGKPIDCKVDSRGLWIAADVVDTAHGTDVRKLLKAGVIKKMSFGFTDLDKRWLEREDDVRGYWRDAGYTPKPEDEDRCKNGALLFTRLKVFEASPVMVPGNEHADITVVRTGDQKRYIEKEGEKWCVFSEDGKKLGEHDTKEEAEAQLAAIEANKNKDDRGFIPLETHLFMALSTMNEISDRLEQRAALLRSHGRSLPPERISVFNQICDRANRTLAAVQPWVNHDEVQSIRKSLLEFEAYLITS